MKTKFLGNTLSGPFTIPSGIVTTATSIIQAMFDHMPQIGVITTKSVGPTPRTGNREPVYSQYAQCAAELRETAMCGLVL